MHLTGWDVLAIVVMAAWVTAIVLVCVAVGLEVARANRRREDEARDLILGRNPRRDL